jgi:ABC-type transporter Mla MlaB component
MPKIKLQGLQSYSDAEILYQSLNSLNIANETLELDCCQIHFVDASCTLALLTVSRLWFRWTGHETHLVGLQDNVHEHICRLNLFDLTGETLVDREPLEYEVPNHFGHINDRRIIPQFIPSHAASNRLVMEDVLDAVEESISVWFNDARLLRDVSMMLSELGENIIHSNDYGYLLLQRYRSRDFPGGTRLVIAISDLGIGIRQSLARTNLIKVNMTDSDCIELALQHRVTGTRENRGIGLEEVRRLALQSAKYTELRIRSGTGVLNIQQNQVLKDDQLASIPGVQITLILEGDSGHNFGVWA